MCLDLRHRTWRIAEDTNRMGVHRRAIAEHMDAQHLRIPVGARWDPTVARTRVRPIHTAAADTDARLTVAAHTGVHQAAMVAVDPRLIPVDSAAPGQAVDSVAAAPTAAEAMSLRAEGTSAEGVAVTLAEVVVGTAVEEAVISVAAVVDAPGAEATADAANLSL